MSDDHSVRVEAGGDVALATGSGPATIDKRVIIERYVEAAELRAPGSAPPAPALFVGRDEAVRELKARLGLTRGQEDAGPAAPVQVVTAVRGWPGVGKTTLVAALAHNPDIAAALPDGVLWAALGPNPDVMSGLADWGRTLDVDLAEYPTPETRSARLAHLLRDQRRLLIIDDVWPDEHGQPTAAWPFLVGGRGCRTLVTTRHADLARALVGRADAVYRLGVLDDVAARELLVELAGPAVDTSALDELIRALDGLPLALTVAGRLLAAEADMGWGLDDLMGELRQRERILVESTGETRPGIPAGIPLTVAAILQLSTDCLSPEARGRFAMLGAFAPKPATWDEAAAAAVWETEDARLTLRLLVNRGLVEPVGTNRFHLHAFLAEHACALTEIDLNAASERHAAHYLAEARSAKPRQYGSLDLDWPQLRTALEYAYTDFSTRGTARLFSDLVLALNGFFSTRGLNYERRDWCERAATACQVLNYHQARAAHIGNLGTVYRHWGDHYRAIRYYQNALDIARQVKDPGNEGTWLGNLGIAYKNLGHYEQAIDCYRQALTIARQIGDQLNECIWQGHMGIVYENLGNHNQARECHQQALDLARQIKDPRYEGIWLCNLGIAYKNLGNCEQAIEYYLESLDIARAIPDRRREGICLSCLGVAYTDLGQYERAHDCYQKALTVIRELGDRRGEAMSLWYLGQLYEKQGDQDRAAEYMQVWVDYEREIGHPDAEKHAAIVAKVRKGE
ncbi:MAG: tetratricopeptide repeat protein [Chloroflexi bacterium]|nr:tetratricopeptide repeat protein [Chloroflexota bacterium]